MPRGRPREFDIDKAIAKAMDVFWSKGYENTTIPDLIEAIGINRPSLYAAFRSKEDLFRLSLDRYRRDPASYVNRALERSTAFEVMQALLYGVTDLVTDPKHPGGCLFVCGSHPLSHGNDGIHQELATRRIAGEKDIRKRFMKAAKDGYLPSGSDPRLIAKLAATLIWGISIQAANGTSRAELRRLAAMTLESLRSNLQR
jgi:AcrR family transcriptional regulator